MRNWRAVLCEDYGDDVSTMIEDLDDEELLDAMEQIEHLPELRAEARARGLPEPVVF